MHLKFENATDNEMTIAPETCSHTTIADTSYNNLRLKLVQPAFSGFFDQN
jgi:hypothetical protein